MKTLIQEQATNYQLIDSGNGQKLEKIGTNTIIRPDVNCIWKPRLSQATWAKAQAIFSKDKGWQKTPSFKEPWLFSYQPPHKIDSQGKTIICELRLSQSKSIGVFPEQSAHWTWMSNLIHEQVAHPQVLNLFGYTGVATLVAAATGAEVCHVDSSQAALTWGRKNQELSKLSNAPIRWIHEDCMKFVTREIAREKSYDALIIDPPAFGRDTKGKSFEFEKQINQLFEQCVKLLKPQPLFIIFNGYSMGYSSNVLKNFLQDYYPKATIEFGELQLKETDSIRNLPCSIFARFKHK